MRLDDFDWFVSHYDELYRKYGRSVLAIKDQRVFGVYTSFCEVVELASRIEEPGTFILQKCSGSEDDYVTRIASPHLMG